MVAVKERSKEMVDDIRSRVSGGEGRKLVPIIGTVDWNNLPYHRLANEFDMANEHEQAAIVESIRKNGFFADEPIILFREDGRTWEIVDGRNRHECGKKAGHVFVAANFVEYTGTLAELEKIIRAKGGARRHETPEQKKKRVQDLLKQYPNMPSRQLARMAGVSHTTIAELRKPKEEDPTYKSLVSAWSKASIEAQERFVEAFKIDLGEMLRA
jgi:hypothetical protein